MSTQSQIKRQEQMIKKLQSIKKHLIKRSDELEKLIDTVTDLYSANSKAINHIEEAVAAINGYI